jgi:hypothetical protein
MLKTDNSSSLKERTGRERISRPFSSSSSCCLSWFVCYFEHEGRLSVPLYAIHNSLCRNSNKYCRSHFERNEEYVLSGVKSGDRGGHNIGPDLTPDFLLQGFVKDNVYITPLPANADDLWVRIIGVVSEVTPDKLRRMWEGIHYRWDVCSAMYGSHTER